METIEVIDKRAASGYLAPEKPEVFGKVEGFIPSRDRILVKRLAPVTADGLIARPDIGTELSERGYVVAVGSCGAEFDKPPVGAIACFSKYGAEEKRFDDDAGPNTYALVWIDDVRGWHA